MTPAIDFDIDERARAEALKATRSFIVKAPAGSGKTQLLTLRLLALLAEVEEPGEILAITFTKAATAEMRERVLSALLRAEANAQMDEPEGKLARAALEHAKQRGWPLLEQPNLLNIQTIDSLCLQIAHGAPLLSRLGGQLQPTEDAQGLYLLAARRTLEELGGGSAPLSDALKDLLRLRDVNLSDCERLIAAMLEHRGQWLGEFPIALSLDEEGWENFRDRLEEPFRREHERVTSSVKQLLGNSGHAHRLFELAEYACGNEPKDSIRELREISSLERLKEIRHYKCIRNFLITQGGDWFSPRGVNKALGFPTERDGGSSRRKQEFQTLLLDLAAMDGLLAALNELDCLPDERFTDEEWRTVRSIFTVLLHAAAELRVVFAEKSAIDFVELGLTAEYALRDPEERRRWSGKIHHLLVDEFQDTSRRQYELLKTLVSAWEPDEGRTCFLVGDPMQSVYLFRQADLALFQEVLKHGLHTDTATVTFSELTLQKNFRSDAGIVNPLNAMFAEMAAENRTRAREKSEFTPAVAKADTSHENAVHVRAQFSDDRPASRTEVEEREAAWAIDAIQRHLPAIEDARAVGKEFRVGVLVRAKRHVAAIAAALRDAEIGYRAIELETLEERQEVRDLLSLLRALLSPVDRVAWLSVLRAPWCGLSLRDLHMLSGDDDPVLLKQPIPTLLPTRLETLSEDGAQRAGRVWQTMQLALRERFSGEFGTSPTGFAAWVERTWHSLGGQRCVDANAYENVQAFFRLLATMTPDGMEASHGRVMERLERFFAQPATDATEKTGVQLMTIHKAKGLGFDVVVVPGLERPTGRDDSPLLQWMARTRYDSDARELLIAPIGNKGEETSATYRWVQRQRENEEREELHRLLYVACTRARTELHLFGSVGVKGGKMGAPKAGTLLAAGWPYLGRMFAEQFAQQSAKPLLVASRDAAVEGDPGLNSQTWGTQFGGRAELAASGSQIAGQMLRRLPVEWAGKSDPSTSLRSAQDDAMLGRFARGEGISVAAQAVGIVLHVLLQQIAALAESDARRNPSGAREYWEKVAAALLRHEGLSPREVAAQKSRVMTLLQRAAADAVGRWILGPRREARSESEWSSDREGTPRALRADRVFLAGSEPLSEAATHLWVVDYKTGDYKTDAGGGAGLLGERSRHAAQLKGYGRVLREALACELPLRLALYYPARPYLDWWEE